MTGFERIHSHSKIVKKTVIFFNIVYPLLCMIAEENEWRRDRCADEPAPRLRLLHQHRQAIAFPAVRHLPTQGKGEDQIGVDEPLGDVACGHTLGRGLSAPRLLDRPLPVEIGASLPRDAVQARRGLQTAQSHVVGQFPLPHGEPRGEVPDAQFQHFALAAGTERLGVGLVVMAGQVHTFQILLELLSS